MMIRSALLLAAVALVLAAPAAASAASPLQIYRDFESHGALTHTYSVSQLYAALTDNKLAAKVGRAQATAFDQAVADNLAARTPPQRVNTGATSGASVGFYSRTLLERIGLATMGLGVALAVFVILWGALPSRARQLHY